MKSKMDGGLKPEEFQQFAIEDREAALEKALQNGGGKIPSGGHISVKSSRSNKMEKHGTHKESHKGGKKRSKNDHDHGFKSKKKNKP